MALLKMNLLSSALMRTVNVNVILPVDKLLTPGAQSRTGPYQTLYLLHGLLGSENDWVTGTAIQRWAEERNLAVVMPAGENSFYVDHEASHGYYGEFIGSELVSLTRKAFPLSDRREDTFLAGLSMGGYGALRNGLKYDGVFGCIASLSAPNPAETVDRLEEDAARLTQSRSFFESRFGPADRVAGSDKDVLWLAKKLCEEGKELPSCSWPAVRTTPCWRATGG
jgi:S-formylglutathione hydrolase FrmB